MEVQRRMLNVISRKPPLNMTNSTSFFLNGRFAFQIMGRGIAMRNKTVRMCKTMTTMVWMNDMAGWQRSGGFW
jgi:hypothetical protein